MTLDIASGNDDEGLRNAKAFMFAFELSSLVTHPIIVLTTRGTLGTVAHVHLLRQHKSSSGYFHHDGFVTALILRIYGSTDEGGIVKIIHWRPHTRARLGLPRSQINRNKCSQNTDEVTNTLIYGQPKCVKIAEAS